LRSARSAALGLVLAFVAGGVSVSAHRMDEYLQAARIGVDPGRVELQLDLTPGVAVAGSVIETIDRDRDGALSSAEKDDYIAAVFGAIEMRIDGRPLRLEAVTTTFAGINALRTGDGVIRLRAVGTLPHLANGAHALSFRNAHRGDVGVYLANALVPATDAVAIHAQRRDAAQTDLTIDYTLSAPRASGLPWWALIGGMVAMLSVVVVRRS
jgi:hypothetical protein